MKPLVVVMGVAGAGKTTIGCALAGRLGAPYAEADDFHPRANVDKMSAGIPLTDRDRQPWLRAIGEWLRDQAGQRGGVASCSALKRRYRDDLRATAGRLWFLHLDGDRARIAARLAGRTGHFMPPALLDSQFAELEPLAPDEAGLRVDVAGHRAEIIEVAIKSIRASTDGLMCADGGES